jgi:hypothetical protein
MAPLAAVSVQGTLPYRPQVFGERGVATSTWASFQAAQGYFSSSAGNGMAPLAAVFVQGT